VNELIGSGPIEDYIRVGDHVRLQAKSSLNESTTGTVLAINGDPGYREFVVVKDGQSLVKDGAFGILERDVVATVERGDCWITLDSLLTIEQATEKCDRSRKNQLRKNGKDFPLFPDQAVVREQSPEEMVSRWRASAQADLERQHASVATVNLIRDEARLLIPPDQFQMLLGRREVYPLSPEYGRSFWTRQLAYFREHGHAEPKPRYPASLKDRILSEFALDGPAIWTTSPCGTQRVRVLWFGSSAIMCRVAGVPIKDYDPILIPKPIVWLQPEEIAKCPNGWDHEWQKSLPDYLKSLPGYLSDIP